MIAFLVVGCIITYVLIGILVVGGFIRIAQETAYEWSLVDEDDGLERGMALIFWPITLIGIMAIPVFKGIKKLLVLIGGEDL